MEKILPAVVKLLSDSAIAPYAISALGLAVAALALYVVLVALSSKGR